MRGVTADFTASIEAEHVRAVIFVRMNFSTGYLRVCNANVNIDWNSQTWLGAGELLSISSISEGSSLEAKTVDIAMSGLDETVLDECRNTYYQGRPVEVWFAPLDSDYRPVSDPWLMFAGRMDFVSVLENSAVYSMRCNSWFEDWNRPRIRRYTDADQQARYPGDKFCEYAEQMAEVKIWWGGSAPLPPPPLSGSITGGKGFGPAPTSTWGSGRGITSASPPTPNRQQRN